MKIAVAVTAFNRDRHLRLCLKHLRRSIASARIPVVVFQDQPAGERTPAWRRTHDLARSTRWVTHVVRKEHMHLRNIVQSVTDLLSEFDAAILVQDDVCVSPDMIPFCVEGLKRFRDVEQVFSICSGQFNLPTLDTHPRRAILTRYFDPQASAIWKRSWDTFDVTCARAAQEFAEPRRLAEFNLLGGTYMSDLLMTALRERECLWDIFWYYHMFTHGAYSLMPKRSLVFNTGVFGGTHMDEYIRTRGSKWQNFLLRLGMRDWLYRTVEAVDERRTRGTLRDYRRPVLDAHAGSWPTIEDAEEDHRRFCAVLDEHGFRWLPSPEIEDAMPAREPEASRAISS